MAKRKRVALIYSYNENWIGGTYYIENLIKALKLLPNEQQPMLLIFTAEAADAERLQQTVQYPHWVFRRFERTLSFPERVLNKLTSVTLGRRFVSLLYGDADLVFPMSPPWRSYFKRIPRHLYWIPDFQEHYLPDFFKPEEIKERKTVQQVTLEVAQHIVFSSHAAKNNFNTIYPDNSLKQYVLQFAVTGSPASQGTADCLARYEIKQPYFICSNQFWKHKNHPTVLRAIAELRRTYPNILVVFTGKEHDYRNPQYFEELTSLKEELNLFSEVKFLGFIPREDQLLIMKEAIAVIQPSLFEGWSTVVEDAKLLQLPVIASKLDVHEEQLADYKAKLFFEPENVPQLVQCMKQSSEGKLPSDSYKYEANVLQFAQGFIEVTNDIISEK